MQQTSVTHEFFLANKDLFEYEKYVGGQDPSQCENAEGIRSFLDRYREIDRHPVSALLELHFSLLHIPTRRYSGTNSSKILKPDFVTLQSTPPIVQDSKNAQNAPFPVCLGSLQLTSQQDQLQRKSLKDMHDVYVPQEYSSPDCVTTSRTTYMTNPHHSPLPLQKQQSPVRMPVKLTESKPKEFCLPKLATLLVDPETRAAATAHKSWDKAHKIEVLVGSKCVGRVNAASRNIPLSIHSRLQASANVSVRRERLYNLLCKDYDQLNKSYTQ